MSIADNLQRIKERIDAACQRAGRDSREVEIVAVSKTVDVDKIKEAIAAGIRIIGENRVQEAWQKYQQVDEAVSWHLIGHLQTNKVKRALQFADVIESVDSLHLAQEINRRAGQLGRQVEVFVEVNTSGEETKFGIQPQQTVPFCRQLAGLPNLRVTGLMTIGAFLPDAELVRPCFVQLRRLRDEVNAEAIPNIQLEHLSMGMTNDFDVAIEEGATLVRIGRALFGERK